MRKPLIAANWKMYKTPHEAADFFAKILPHVHTHERDEIVVCAAGPLLPACREAAAGSKIHIGGQNLYWKDEGAYTGEVSGRMLRSVGCTHVIIGHSERRQYFGETDDTVNLKLKAALKAGLIPIVCVGEVLEEREAGITDDVLRRQCGVAFREISSEEARTMVVAYEPVWAIGTGRTATPQVANAAHITIREEARMILGEPIASGLRILYGGSVKPDNIKELMAQPDIDGALVGGASLDTIAFTKIIQY